VHSVLILLLVAADADAREELGVGHARHRV
jgi:hypothetical protein